MCHSRYDIILLNGKIETDFPQKCYNGMIYALLTGGVATFSPKIHCSKPRYVWWLSTSYSHAFCRGFCFVLFFPSLDSGCCRYRHVGFSKDGSISSLYPYRASCMHQSSIVSCRKLCNGYTPFLRLTALFQEDYGLASSVSHCLYIGHPCSLNDVPAKAFTMVACRKDSTAAWTKVLPQSTYTMALPSLSAIRGGLVQKRAILYDALSVSTLYVDPCLSPYPVNRLSETDARIGILFRLTLHPSCPASSFHPLFPCRHRCRYRCALLQLAVANCFGDNFGSIFCTCKAISLPGNAKHRCSISWRF